MIPRILITGGSGILASALKKYCDSSNIICFAPNKKECDILSRDSIRNAIKNTRPTILIHAAAYVDTVGCENNIDKSIDINVIGTANVVIESLNTVDKLVYMSTEYVFSGKSGNYTVDDRLDPINVYGKTKAAGEYIVSSKENHQILRAAFIRKEHTHVFNDQYCSRYFLYDIVPIIINNILYNNDKIVHISNGKKMRTSEIFENSGRVVTRINIPDEHRHIIPTDTSLKDSSKF